MGVVKYIGDTLTFLQTKHPHMSRNRIKDKCSVVSFTDVDIFTCQRHIYL